MESMMERVRSMESTPKSERLACGSSSVTGVSISFVIVLTDFLGVFGLGRWQRLIAQIGQL